MIAIMFSSRLAWETQRNSLTEAVAAHRDPLIDLTQPNPTQAGIVYPPNLLEAFTDPRAMEYDPDPRGLGSARTLLAERYSVAPERVMITASTSEAYSWLFKLLCNPGDEVLVPRPSYPLFDFLAALESVTIRQYPLRYHEGWWIDLDELERSITPRTRAVLLVNPNNPTGSYIKQDELARLNTICATHNLAIISDEVFSGYQLINDPSQVPTLLKNTGVLTFCLNGLSKLIGLPQMKLGWLIAGGPRSEEALNKLEFIADTYLSVGTPVQYALPRLLALEQDIQTQIRTRARANLAGLRQSGLSLLRVEGGWYATIIAPRTRTEEAWTLQLLSTHGVLVQPGHFYDFETEAFLVVSLLTEPGAFQEGTRRIASEITV